MLAGMLGIQLIFEGFRFGQTHWANGQKPSARVGRFHSESNSSINRSLCDLTLKSTSHWTSELNLNFR
jgi:hypothetical protein